MRFFVVFLIPLKQVPGQKISNYATPLSSTHFLISSFTNNPIIRMYKNRSKTIILVNKQIKQENNKQYLMHTDVLPWKENGIAT
jgi:hypothetical protein